MIEIKKITGVLLAGGLATRMGGGDKCLLKLGGKSLLSYALDRASKQVGQLILNANGDSSRFEEFNLPVVPDVIEGAQGPLAGVLTGMEWALQNISECEWIVTFPTDAPFFPADFVDRMLRSINKGGADMVCAQSNERSHPVFALWPTRLASDLRRAILEENIRKIDKWTSKYKIIYVDWSSDPLDPFFNINCPKDIEQAEKYLI